MFGSATSPESWQTFYTGSGNDETHERKQFQQNQFTGTREFGTPSGYVVKGHQKPFPHGKRGAAARGRGRASLMKPTHGQASSNLASCAVTKTEWRCQHCGKTYSTRSGLYFHEATHTGQYKHTCFLCEKGFMQTSLYNAHIKTHQKQFKASQGTGQPNR